MHLDGADAEKFMQQKDTRRYILIGALSYFMDDTLILISVSCVALAVLVWLMWRDAVRPGWGEMSQSEKKKWREEELKRKGK